MNVGLYQSASSLSALERWQDAVAQNITSNQVAGYKKQTVQLAGYVAGEIQGDASQRVGDGGGTPVEYPRAHMGISFSKGESMPTRRDFDFALGGAGFFQLQDGDGRIFYSRNGSFATTPELELVNHNGYDVLGDGGTAAPSFEEIRAKRSPAEIRLQLVNQGHRHGNGRIPDFSHLSDKEIRALVNFIQPGSE